MKVTRRNLMLAGAFPVVLLIAAGYVRLDAGSVTKLLCGLVLLVAGAESLVRGAIVISRRMGLSSMLVGMTIVAFGTSLPELAAGIETALENKPEINVGNVIGSNIANVGLILGVTAMVYPVACRLTVLRREVPFMILVSGLGYVVLRDGLVSRFEASVLIALGIAFVGSSYLMDKGEGQQESKSGGSGRWWTGPMLVAIGLVVLAGGATLLVAATEAIAIELGMPMVVVSLTVVALGTSLPELATCVIAALRREMDLVVGNVLGSIIFNILFVLGVSALIRPIVVPDSVIHRDIFVMMGFAVICFPMMRTRGELTRLEGLLLFVVYLVYVVVVFRLG
ncbi:MAG: calcium/sodium antiporter [Planctomycetes bacterium]|nr:calcium/sodium antiporter [Planctomycetota bacterium]